MINRATFTSWEFILLVLTNAAAWLATAGNTITSHNAFVFSALSAAVYALARGFAKINADGKPIYATTEFYVAIIGAAAAFVGNLDGHIGDSTLKLLLGALAAASAIANGLRTPPAVAVAPTTTTTQRR
jgi:hypothetical protein